VDHPARSRGNWIGSEKEYKRKQQEGKLKKGRWKYIKAWIKLAKDGRILGSPAFLPLLLPPSAFCGVQGLESLCEPPPNSCEGEPQT
jgi:hypothetical protein